MKKLKIILLSSIIIFGWFGCESPTSPPYVPPKEEPNLVIGESYALMSPLPEATIQISGEVQSNANNLYTKILFEYGFTKSYGDTLIGKSSEGYEGIVGVRKRTFTAKIVINDVSYFGKTLYFRMLGVNEKEVVYGDNNTFIIPMPVEEQKIGSYYQGGIIISINPPLISAIADISDSTIGMSHIEAIVAANKVGNGFRLPDTNEIKILFQAKQAGTVKNFVGIKWNPVGTYWCSNPSNFIVGWGLGYPMNNPINNRNIVHTNRAEARLVKSFNVPTEGTFPFMYYRQ